MTNKYIHINNLYRPDSQDILLFKECYCLEKIHGTFCKIDWDGKNISFFSGGEEHNRFVGLFDVENLKTVLSNNFPDIVVKICGEGYGGRQQSMSATYGKELRFVVFDVQVGDVWLAVPQAEDVATKLGLEFVYYTKVSTDLESLDKERDADSVQAVRNGMGSGKMREGVVLRPIVEMTKNNGQRIIAKHKRSKFGERASKPKVIDPSKVEVLKNANAIADEYVTAMRLEHVLDKNPDITGIEHTGKLIKVMVEDVQRESETEVVWSKEAASAVGKKVAQMWKAKICQIRKD
jgi:hypothetical protein